METASERLLRYVQIDTQSKEDCDFVPSTPKQHDLARLLYAELTAMGASRVRYDEEHAYVYAEIPANCTADVPALGFIAHMDTVEGVSGDECHVHPRIHKDYDGGNVVLNEALGIVLSPAEFPSLANAAGKTLITTDGTTVLGADDKAGVSEIMVMAETLLTHPEIHHGKILIGFTPDEEVGNGVRFFDVQNFGAEFAYTVDGGALGELEYENFNAASAKLTFRGKSVHPGSAKGVMVNAALLAMEFNAMLPPEKAPMYTEGYDGFYHLTYVEGSTEEAASAYIIREHDKAKFDALKAHMAACVDFLNTKYGEGTVTAVIRDSYYNMSEIIRDHFELITRARDKMLALGIEPIIRPIRGGTDGATLSFRGLPCPNLCTGGYNFHGRYEYICAEDMDRVAALLVALATADEA